jgi:hypothetical protein
MGNTILQESGIENVLICGTSWSDCIRITSLSAVAKKFNTICIKGCVVGGTGGDDSDITLELMEHGVSIDYIKGMMEHFDLDVENAPKPEEAPSRDGFMTRNIRWLLQKTLPTLGSPRL